MSGLSLNTPATLLQMGVPANLGNVMLPRGWMSCKDQEIKNHLLHVAWILPASKAVPRPGDRASWDDGASQQQMALMSGVDRSTMNRHIQKFCGDDAKIAAFFNKWRPQVGVINRYSDRTPKVEPALEKKTVLKKYDPDKLAARFGDQYFDPAMEGVGGCGPVAMWTFDPNIRKPMRCGCRKGQMRMNFSSQCLKCGGKGYTLHPKKKMGLTPRSVMSVLQLKGLGRLVGFLELTSVEIGRLCGLCENTVADALDQWEDLKVLQIVPGRVVYEPGTNVVKFRYPQRIIWLPGLLLDPEMVRRERERFAAHLAATRELALLNGWAAAGVHLARVQALHEELLRRWAMSRHSLGAFWTAMRRLIYTEGMPCGRSTKGSRGVVEDYRDALFPVHLRE